MYLRPASFNELRDWLLANGYGQVSVDEMAEALLAKFDIIFESPKASG